MTKKQIGKAAALNGAIVIIDILLLSEGFFHLLSQENIILWAIGIAVIVMSILFFFYGNYTILIKKPTTKLYKASELQDYDDFIAALKSCPNQKIFKSEIEETMKQTERMRKKTEVLNTILLQYFEEGEMSYARFLNVIDGTRAVFFENVKKIINSIMLSDAEHSKHSKEECHYMERIKDAIKQNVILLKKLDALTLEISKLDDRKETDFDVLPMIKEINRLIEETKYYSN